MNKANVHHNFRLFFKIFSIKKIKIILCGLSPHQFFNKKRIINLCMFIKIKNPCKKNKDKLYV
jgi:hypothetical protein